MYVRDGLRVRLRLHLPSLPCFQGSGVVHHDRQLWADPHVVGAASGCSLFSGVGRAEGVRFSGVGVC